MNVLVNLRGAAYADERAYNELRPAGDVAKRDDVEVRILCFGAALGCANVGQRLPNGHDPLDRMITSGSADTSTVPPGRDATCAGETNRRRTVAPRS